MTAAESRNRIARMAVPALFAALVAASAFFVVPLPGIPVPIVLQNMLAVLTGILLGPLRGGLAVGAFLLLGAMGFPVFSRGHSGLAWLLGPTGGYLFAYLIAAVLAGLLARTRRLPALIAASFGGFALILGLGTAWLKYSRGLGWIEATAAGLTPFLLGDGVKAVLTVLLGRSLGPFFDGILGARTTRTP